MRIAKMILVIFVGVSVAVLPAAAGFASTPQMAVGSVSVPDCDHYMHAPAGKTQKSDSVAALQTTVDLHLEGQAGKIPALAVLQASEEAIRARGAAIASHLANLPLDIEIGRGQAKTGGGTLPRSKVPSVTLEIVSKESSLAEFAGDLRTSNPPVIGYIADNRFKLDLRTIFPQQDDLVIEAIRAVCTK